MKEINSKKSYTLLLLIVASTLLFSIVGNYWNKRYYHDENTYTMSTPPLASAMRGIHDKLYITDFASLIADYAVDNLSILSTDAQAEAPAAKTAQQPLSEIISTLSPEAVTAPSGKAANMADVPEVYEFTTATEDYFADACFIGARARSGLASMPALRMPHFCARPHSRSTITTSPRLHTMMKNVCT